MRGPSERYEPENIVLDPQDGEVVVEELPYLHIHANESVKEQQTRKKR
jgi:hypothetical protein